MVYKARPGVVRVRICDTDILTAKREVWDQCPTVFPLPRLWAYAWFLIERRGSSEEALESMSVVMKKSVDELREQFAPCFEKLSQMGFLIPAEEET